MALASGAKLVPVAKYKALTNEEFEIALQNLEAFLIQNQRLACIIRPGKTLFAMAQYSDGRLLADYQALNLAFPI